MSSPTGAYLTQSSQPPFRYSISTGDTFNYAPWGGICTAMWSGDELWMARDKNSTSGTCVWKATATRSLLSGEKVQILWDHRTYLHAQMVDMNTIRVWHQSTPYDFQRDPRNAVAALSYAVAVAMAEAAPEAAAESSSPPSFPKAAASSAVANASSMPPPTPEVSTPVRDSLTSRLMELREALSAGLISEEEFSDIRKKMLDAFAVGAAGPVTK